MRSRGWLGEGAAGEEHERHLCGVGASLAGCKHESEKGEAGRAGSS